MSGAPLPLTQFTGRPGAIDLAWGHPDPSLLPVGELAAATDETLRRYGSDALAYGAEAGPGPVLEEIAARLGVVDRRAPALDELCLVPGASPGLDQAATLLTEPGDVVLVEGPTYHFALGILAGHPVEIRAVPVDGEGLVVEALAELLAGIRAAGRRARLLYTIPTFHNPTGVSLAPDRRRALVDLAAANGLLLVEDDVYRELPFDGPAPDSLWSDAPPGTVVRLGSFAKSLAPGLRVGYVTADRTIAARFAGQGYLASGGALSHLPALVVATYMADGRYAANVERLRVGYRERRDALLDAFAAALPAGSTWTRPAGGYFAWVTLPEGRDAGVARRAVEAAGSGYLPGSVFCRPTLPGDPPPGPFTAVAGRSFRVSFARWSPTELRESAARLGRGLAAAS
ncbi:MAG: hypothetical protein RL338_864 [Chloroflexota bacterium]